MATSKAYRARIAKSKAAKAKALAVALEPGRAKKKKGVSYKEHRRAAEGKRPPIEGRAELMLPPSKNGNEIYNTELAEAILARIAGGESVIAICSDVGMPDARTVTKWALFKPEFKLLYDMAIEIRSHIWKEKLRDIAEQTDQGVKTVTYYDEKGKVTSSQVSEADQIEHRKLKIGTYQWLMERMNPKAFGQKVETKNVNDHNINIKVIKRVIIDPKTIDHEG